MARTKASVGSKVSSGKSSKARCSAAPPPSSSSSSGSNDKSSRGPSGGGGNPVCPRPTPKWQKPIVNFFISKSPEKKKEASDSEDVSAGSSKTKRRANIIESDDEDIQQSPEKPVNKVLDETIELEPLTGEKSHKIDEYYPKNGEDDNGEKAKPNGESIHQNGETSENGDTTNYNNEVLSEKDCDKDEIKVSKGKGRGKKTNKENVNNNTNKSAEKRKSVKRDLETSISDNESDKFSKKVKVN